MRRLAHRKHYTSTFRHMACGPTDGHTHMVLVDPAASHGREARRSPLIRLQITEHSTQSTAGEEKNKKISECLGCVMSFFIFSRTKKKNQSQRAQEQFFHSFVAMAQCTTSTKQYYVFLKQNVMIVIIIRNFVDTAAFVQRCSST